MKNKIPVVFLTDNNYVIPTSVAIQSMIINSLSDNFFDIYIIVKDVSKKNKECFKEFEGDNIRINFIDVKKLSLEKYNEEGYYVSSTALLKFNIADLLPQYDKVLYIDGDVLVLKNIEKLYEIDVEGYCVAAIPDMAAIDSCHFDEHLDIRNYFNSGIMLLNTKLIREENLSEELYKVKQLHPEYRCMDQDVFNAVFSRRVLFLPPKYNLMFYNFIIAKYSLNRVNEFYNTKYKSFDEMEEDAVIIHLTNEKKPWKYRDAYKSKEWYDYYIQTPFYRCGLEVNYEEQQVLKTKKGPFVKIWTPEVTTLYLGRIPLVKKIRANNEIQIKIFGIKVLKKKTDGYTFSYYFMGVRYKKVYDSGYFLHRLFTYKDILCMSINQFADLNYMEIGELKDGKIGSTRDQIYLLRQLERLKEMKRQHEKNVKEV